MKRCIYCAYLMTCEKASVEKNECNKFIKRTNEEEKKDEKDLRNYMEVNLKMVDEIESDFEINLAEITVDEKSQIKMKHLDEYTEKEKYNRMKSKQNTRKMAREYEER